MLSGARVIQLYWNPASPHRGNDDLRTVIAEALQQDRTLDSVVPPQIPGHRTSFLTGGSATVKVGWDDQIPLSLGYDPTIPDNPKLARQVRNRLETAGGMTVRLAPADTNADLLLEDRKAWTPTAIAWLQPLLDNPLPSSVDSINRAEQQARSSDDPATMNSALATLQDQAVRDGLLLPLIQQNEYIYIRHDFEIAPTSFGPGWQLGLWGISAH